MQVAVTIKLEADEFQTLREELREHETHLRDVARIHTESCAYGSASSTRKRAEKVKELRERLG